MKVLVVGYGSMGRRHAANARALGHEVAVVDLDAERRGLAAESGLTYFSDDDMAAMFFDPEAVVIATPAADHGRALNTWSGRAPVLVEKPLALSAGEISQRVMDTDLVVVGYNWRWHRGAQAWADAFGVPDRMVLSCDTRIAEWPGRGYADPILEMSHEIDLLTFWRGRWPVLTGVTRYADGCRLLFDTEDAVVLRWNAPPARWYAGFVGAETSTGYEPMLGADLEQSYRDEMEEFMLYAADPSAETRLCTLADGWATLRICEQAIRMRDAR